MDNERSIDKLARYTMYAAGGAICCALCWYFRSVLVYILIAAVVSLIGKPIMRGLRKIRIRRKSAPDWLLATFTLLIIFCVLALTIIEIIPAISGIAGDFLKVFHSAGISDGFHANDFIEKVNAWIINSFPALGPDFTVNSIVASIFKRIMESIAPSAIITSVIGGVASTTVAVVIGVFSVIFIAFFFIKNENLFGNIIAALVPERAESKVIQAINTISSLLSRYFVGIFVESFGVAVVNFLGLWLIARFNMGMALGIAVLAGILNIIPYVGPLIAEVIGVIFGIILKMGFGIGPDVNIFVFAMIVLAVMLGTQLLDNFLFQPLIYSTSIKAKPLEIFIVLLIAGYIGGIVGMLVAIPCYTVIRVIAFTFFPNVKAIRKLKESNE